MTDKYNQKKTEGKELSFLIRVQYRRNSSMQGSIQWLEGREQQYFRSALELGKLINDCKNKVSDSEDKNSGKLKWSDKESVS